ATHPCTVNTEILLKATAVGSYTFSVTATDNVDNMASASRMWNVSHNVEEKMKDHKVDQDRPVDILFVVDNSGSMDYERSGLANRINGFMDKINGLDWQIAVISTDNTSNKPEKDGRFVPFRGLNNIYILDSSMDPGQAQAVFGDTIQRFP